MKTHFIGLSLTTVSKMCCMLLFFFIPQFYSLHLVGRREENTLFVIFNFIKGISSSCYIVKLFK